MIISAKSFEFNRFLIPDFSLKEGNMLRFWVQILPQERTEKDGYYVMKKFQKYLTGNTKTPNIIISEKLNVSNYKTKNKWYNWPKNQTVAEYLNKYYHLEKSVIAEKLAYFNIKKDFQLNKLGHGHQRVFSIICEFQKSKNVIFDYYGLSPQTEENLTKYIQSELLNGKSAISFDNLQFKNENNENERIIHKYIWRKDKVGIIEKYNPNFKLRK